MKCPECGSDMENGVVSAPGIGMVWSEGPIKILFSGEEIPLDGGFVHLVHMDGHRCTACRLIVAHYLEDSQPNILQTMISANKDDRS
jgi:hypothetical protein